MSSLKLLFYKVNDSIAKLEVFLTVIFMALLVLIMVVQVVLRYVFNSPLFWAEEISLQLLVLITLFGVSYLTYKKSFLQVDLLQHYLSAKMKHVLSTVLAIINLLVFVVLAYLFVTWATDPMVQADVSGTTGIPRWYNYAVASLAICFMAYHQLCNVISALTFQSNEEQVGAGGLL